MHSRNSQTKEKVVFNICSIHNVKCLIALAVAMLLLWTYYLQAQGVPYPALAIAPLGSNALSLTITNGVSGVNYGLLWTPNLNNTMEFPWIWAAWGASGQTNFSFNVGSNQSGFFEAVMEYSAIPVWQNCSLFQNGLGAWFNGRMTEHANPSLPDGSPLTVTNLSGPLSIINGANGSAPVEFSSSGAKGLPGFLFPSGGNSELEISNAFVGVQNFTIEITFLDFNGTNNEINFLLQAGGWGQDYPYSFRISPWIDAPIGGQVTGGSLGYFGYAGDGLTTSRGVIQSPGLVHTFIFNFDGTNDWWYFDGQRSCDSRLQPSDSSAALLANATNLYIGGQITGGANFNGIILDFHYFTNMLSDPACQALNTLVQLQAELPTNVMTLSGDSIAVGLHTTAVLASLPQFMGAAYTNYLINTIGYSGRTTPEDYTNIVQWLSFKPPGNKVFFDYIGVNCFNGLSGPQQVSEVPVALSWLTNEVQLLTSHGVTPIVSTLMSCQAETNSIVTSGYDWRSDYNAVVLSFTNLGAVVANFAGVPSLGTNGAYLDANFVDGLHPSAVGYTNMWTVLFPLVTQQVYGVQ